MEIKREFVDEDISGKDVVRLRFWRMGEWFLTSHDSIFLTVRKVAAIRCRKQVQYSRGWGSPVFYIELTIPA